MSVNSNISMVVRVCTHCNQVIGKCRFQRYLRGFHLDDFADIYVQEVEFPSGNKVNVL